MLVGLLTRGVTGLNPISDRVGMCSFFFGGLSILHGTALRHCHYAAAEVLAHIEVVLVGALNSESSKSNLVTGVVLPITSLE